MNEEAKSASSVGTFAGEKVRWYAEEVKPGTPYEDEPDEMVPVGWYVIAASVDDIEQKVVISVEAVHSYESDMCGEVAKAIAAGLNGTTIGGVA